MSRSKSRKFADILSGNMGNILDDGLIDATEISNLGTAATAATTDFLPSTMATATNATGSDFVPVYDASAGVWKKQTITVAALQGPTGATGATGPAGSNGSIGADGADGAQGPQGNTGATGPQGATGPAGTPSTSNGTVGSYALLNLSSYAITSFGTTRSGSQLRHSSVYRHGYNTTTVSGTWRCMGQTGTVDGSNTFSGFDWRSGTLWVRIS